MNGDEREAAPSGKQTGESIAGTAGYTFAAQLIAAAFTAGLTVFLARNLGPQQFGEFSLALSIGALVLLPADFGISQSAARFIAERRGDRDAVGDVALSSTRLKLLTSSIAAGALLLAAQPIADAYQEPDLAWAVRGAALVVFAQSFLQGFGVMAVAVARGMLGVPTTLLKSVVEVTASIALVLGGAGAAGATFGRGAGFLAGTILLGLLLFREIGLPSRDRPDSARLPTRSIASYAGAVLIIEGAYSLFDQIDVLLIGALLSASAAGLFQAPLRLIAFIGYPGAAVAAGVAPRLARHRVRGANVRAFETALRYIVIIQMAFVVPLVVWAEPIMVHTLGAEFRESSEVLRALGPYIFLLGIGPVATLGVSYLGEARLRIPIAIATVLVNVGIDLLLIPQIGIVGAAIGTNIAYAIYVPAHLYICRRLLGMPLRPVAITVVRASIAGLAMAGVLALFGTSEVAIPVMLGGVLAAAAVYVAVLFATREVSLAKLAEARELFTSPDDAGPDDEQGEEPRQAAPVGAPRPMRIISLSGYNGPYPGSFIPMLRAMSRRARAAGHQPEIVLAEHARESSWVPLLEADGIPVRFLEPMPRRDAATAIEAILAESELPTVLHSHFTAFDIASVIAGGKRPGTAVYWHLHSPAERSAGAAVRNRIRYRTTGRQVDGVFAVAENIAASARKRGAPRDRLEVVPNAIDVAAFAPAAPEVRAQARSRLGLPADAEVVLHFGWDWERKGGDLLLAAARDLIEGGRSGLMVATVGGGEKARTEAAALGIADHVLALEPSSDVAGFYAAADVFASTSREEGMPFSIVEAACSGVPTAATDIPGQRLIADTLGAAVEVTPAEADAVGLALGRWLDMPADHRRQICDQARTAAETRLGLDSWADGLIARFERDLRRD